MTSLLTPMQLSDLRALFPYLGERNYLDTAAAGLTWSGHGAAVARFFDEVKSRGIDARPEWQALAQRVRSRLAQWLGVGSDDVTFVANTTEGLNLAAQSLRLSPGERVLMAADEFASVRLAWAAAGRAGVEVAMVPIADEARRQETLLAALDGRTRVLAVSHTHWSTGTTVDLAVLAQACQRNDTLLVVDGIQALGAIPVRLDGVAVYAASFFKWMLSGFGIGVLVTSAAARQQMQPAYGGYANEHEDVSLQYAHVNLPALYGLDATLDLFERIGRDTVHAQVRHLGRTLAAAADRHGLDLITPRDRSAGIWVLRTPDAEAVRAALAQQGISVSARGGGVRVSPHVYNTTTDVEQGIEALARALPERR